MSSLSFVVMLLHLSRNIRSYLFKDTRCRQRESYFYFAAVCCFFPHQLFLTTVSSRFLNFVTAVTSYLLWTFLRVHIERNGDKNIAFCTFSDLDIFRCPTFDKNWTVIQNFVRSIKNSTSMSRCWWCITSVEWRSDFKDQRSFIFLPIFTIMNKCRQSPIKYVQWIGKSGSVIPQVLIHSIILKFERIPKIQNIGRTSALTMTALYWILV